MPRDWASLPWPALNLTSEFLNFPVDYIRFRSVCTSWRSSAPKLHHPPLLAGHRLERTGLSDDDDDHYLPTIFNLSIFTGSRIVPIGEDHPLLPERTLGRPCCGSSHGWMALLDPTPALTLLNPLTKSLISLPTLTDYPDINEGRYRHRKVSKVGDGYAIRFGGGFKERKVKSFGDMQVYLASKLILSSDPSTDTSCVALLLRCDWRRLAVCKIGDQSWTPVKFREFINFNTDAVFYKGRFHVVCRKRLYVLNLGQEPELEIIPMANPPFDYESELWQIDECYLVESSGDLLVVYAYYLAPFVDSRDYVFEVYKVDWGMHRIKMLKLRSLGDVALFLGRNHSISLSASKFPGIRANCIYMAEYYKRRRQDIRVYHMDDGKNEFISNSSADPQSGWRPCAWIMPSLL